MASRYEIVNYIKAEHPGIANTLGSDKDIYEWARRKYLRNYPSWDEVDKKFEVNKSDTSTFNQPKNKIQSSNLKSVDSSPAQFEWLERFVTYGGMAEEALGKGKLGDTNVIRMVSQGLGISDDYWEQSYNNSMAGLMYSAFTGQDKYIVEDFHEGGKKGAFIDAASFLTGMLNPVDAALFAVSGGAGKIGTAIGESAIKRALVKKGVQHNAGALVGNRPLLRSMVSQGAGTSASLATFFAAQGGVAEASRQGKAIRAGEMDDYDYGEMIKKSAEHGQEGAIIGGAIGVGIGGSMGSRYGQLVLKSKAEGKNLTRFENIQKALTHPVLRVGSEGAFFQFSGDVYGKIVRDEKMTPFLSPEWWEEYIHSTTVLGGLKLSGKVWSKALGKETQFGEDADRIMMEGLKDARSFSEGMEKSLKNVKNEVGDVSPAVKDALNTKLISEEIKLNRSEAEFKMISKEVKEMQSLLAEFNDKGANIGQAKMKRLVELISQNNNMYTALLEDMKNNPDKAYDIASRITGKKPLSEADKKGVDNYVEKTLKTLETVSILANAPANGGMHIPKEGINTGIKANELPSDGTTSAKVDNNRNVIVYGAHTKVPKDWKDEVGRPPEKPIGTVGQTLEQIKSGIEKITKVPTVVEEIQRKQANLGEDYSAKVADYGVLKLKSEKDLKKPSERIVNYTLNLENTKDFKWADKLKTLDGDVKTDVERVNRNALLDFVIHRAKTVSEFTKAKSDAKVALRFLDILKNRVAKDVSNMTVSDIKEATTLLQMEHFAKTGKFPDPTTMSAISKFVQESMKKFYTNPEALPNWNPKDIGFFVEANKLTTNIPKPLVRDKAIQVGNVLSKTNKTDAYSLVGELGARKGLRSQEINSIMSSDIRDYNGKWMLNLKPREIKVNPESGERTVTGAGKFNTIERDIWLGDVANANSLGSRLKKYLDINKTFNKKIVEEIGKKLPSDRKRGKFFDLRTSIQTALAENPSVTKDMINFFLGHDVSRIDKSYVNFSLDKKIEHQKLFESILEGAKKRVAVRKPSEVVFKTQGQRDIALRDFMARNKMSPETLKEAGLGKNEMGEFMDGAIKLAKGEWQPIDFFHENAHRLKYYAESNNNKKLLKMFAQGERLAKGSKEYKEWLRVNPQQKNLPIKDSPFPLKNPVEEFFTDVIAGKGVTREYSKGFINKIKQWAKNLVSSFKVAFNKGDYKDIARVLSGKVQKGFEIKSGLKTGEKKFRVIPEIGKSTFEQIAPKEYVRAIKKSVDKLIEKYNPSVQDKKEIIKIIAEDAGLKDFKLSEKTSLEDLGTFYNHLETSIPLGDIPKKVNLASWFRNYRTAENTRLKANVSKEAQKEWLQTLGVSDGNIFRATTDQLKAYQAVLHTMKYEKKTGIDWIDNEFMFDNIPDNIRKSFVKYSGTKQFSFPVHIVFEGMGLKKLAKKMIDHTAIEQGHIGEWIVFENEAKKAIGNNVVNRRWNKYKDFLYLFDRQRYVQRRDANKLTRAERIFINKATTKEWRDGTKKSVKDMFANTKEGKLGELYTEHTKYYKNTFNDILALHMNPAEFQKWKDNNYVRWVEDKVYISRQLTDKFKKLYDARGREYERFVESQAKIMAEKRAKKLYGDKYTTEQYSEAFDWAMSRAWAELSDMFSFSNQKFSSKFLEKRNLKLPEFVEIGGKKVQVYETSYDKTIVPYATGMSKFLANLEIFPEFSKLKGFKVYDSKEVMAKLETVDPKHGKWVRDQINTRLGIGASQTGDMASKAVTFTSKSANLLSKIGLSFPTAGLKNILVGNTQTALAFKATDFVRGFWDAISRDKRMSVKRTGATELGMRHLVEHRTFKPISGLSEAVFVFGGMKPTENINRYVSVLAGRHDQARGVEILRRYKPDSKKYKRVAGRFKDFYKLSSREIDLIREYGLNGLDGVKFKSPVEKAQIGRELDRLYQKMDSMAHINTQGASVDVFMPYWWNKGFVKPFTLYKRMAYAASANTVANLKDAWKGKNFSKLGMFMLGTYFTGEQLMAIQNNYLGTPVPTKNEDFWSRAGLVLWKAEFLGLGSEFMKLLYGDDQIGFQIYPAITTAADNAIEVVNDLWNIATDMPGAPSKAKSELVTASADDYLSKTVSLWGNTKKLIENRKDNKYSKEYRQASAYAREFTDKSGLSSNTAYEKHGTSYYWDLFEKSWNKGYMYGKKDEFYKVFWLTYMGIANDYRNRGMDIDGIPIKSWDDAFKQAGRNIKTKMKTLNPNRYTYTKKSKDAKMKAFKYQQWLGKEKYSDVLKVESQYARNYRIFWDKDFATSANINALEDMLKYFK